MEPNDSWDVGLVGTRSASKAREDARRRRRKELADTNTKDCRQVELEGEC